MLPEQETVCGGRCGDVGVVCRGTTVSRSAAADCLGSAVAEAYSAPRCLLDE